MWRHNVQTQQPERAQPEQDPDTEEVSTELNTSMFGMHLEVSKNKLAVQYTGSGAHANDVGSIQGNHPVPRKQLIYYFEIIINHSGDSGLITIGFTDKPFKLSRQPGWEPNSYGYHGEDGHKYTGGKQGEAYAEKFAAGDTVGAGLNLEQQHIFFTKNGTFLGVAFRGVTTSPLYPTVSLHSRNENVAVNFGQEPFRFDIAALVAEERAKKAAAVESVGVPAGAMLAVVRDYLGFYGYADTLEAFNRSAGSDAASGPGAASTSASGGDGEHTAWPALQARAEVRQHVMAGRIAEAREAAERASPEACPADCQFTTGPEPPGGAGSCFGPRPPQPSEVFFYLACLTFVEHIRGGSVEAAVAHAQATLAGLRGALTHRSEAYDAMLKDVVALLAYRSPERSSLAGLLEPAQREAVADVLNAALLAHAWPQAGHGTELPPTQAVLERLLQQLVTVHAEVREANGGQGEPFQLRRHIPPSPPMPHAAPSPRAPPKAFIAHANGTNGML